MSRPASYRISQKLFFDPVPFFVSDIKRDTLSLLGSIEDVVFDRVFDRVE